MLILMKTAFLRNRIHFGAAIVLFLLFGELMTMLRNPAARNAIFLLLYLFPMLFILPMGRTIQKQRILRAGLPVSQLEAALAYLAVTSLFGTGCILAGTFWMILNADADFLITLAIHSLLILLIMNSWTLFIMINAELNRVQVLLFNLGFVLFSGFYFEIVSSNTKGEQPLVDLAGKVPDFFLEPHMLLSGCLLFMLGTFAFVFLKAVPDLFRF